LICVNLPCFCATWSGLQVYMGTLSQKCVRQWPYDDPEQSVLWGNLRKGIQNIDPVWKIRLKPSDVLGIFYLQIDSQSNNVDAWLKKKNLVISEIISYL
jgi:hypothetical protein